MRIRPCRAASALRSSSRGRNSSRFADALRDAVRSASRTAETRRGREVSIFWAHDVVVLNPFCCKEQRKSHGKAMKMGGNVMEICISFCESGLVEAPEAVSGSMRTKSNLSAASGRRGPQSGAIGPPDSRVRHSALRMWHLMGISIDADLYYNLLYMYICICIYVYYTIIYICIYVYDVI